MADRRGDGSADGPDNRAPDTSQALVLVIGRADEASLAQAAALGTHLFVSPVSGLDGALLARLAPEWVIFPLISTGFDAPLVIEMLSSLGYSGRACVMAPPLPNRRMVEIELRSIAPALKLVLVEIPE